MPQYEWSKRVSSDVNEINDLVFVHVPTGPNLGDWLNIKRRFLRLPQVGEYLAIEHDSAFFRVVAVVHCPFDADFGAEVYCALDDYGAAHHRFTEAIWPNQR